MKRLYVIKTHSPYVPGVVTKEIRLTFRERLAILFHGGIRITLVGDENWARYIKEHLEAIE